MLQQQYDTKLRLSKEEEQVIIGTMLGDAGCVDFWQNQYYRIRFHVGDTPIIREQLRKFFCKNMMYKLEGIL